MKKLKIALIALSMVILVSASAFSYAYWDSLRHTESTGLPIGKGTVLNVSLSSGLTAGKTLVPPDAVLGVDDIDEAVFTYKVNVSKDTATPLNLAVTFDNVLIGGLDTYSSLILFDIVVPSPLTVTDQTVTVTVRLSNSVDITPEAYAAINSNDVTFDLIFNAS